MNRKKWLEKMERDGRADDTLIIINGRHYTPRDIAKKELFWIQVVKSI
jgi:hypothetical protein